MEIVFAILSFGLWSFTVVLYRRNMFLYSAIWEDFVLLDSQKNSDFLTLMEIIPDLQYDSYKNLVILVIDNLFQIVALNTKSY